MPQSIQTVHTVPEAEDFSKAVSAGQVVHQEIHTEQFAQAQVMNRDLNNRNLGRNGKFQ